MQLRDRYVSLIEDIPELRVAGDPPLSVISYCSDSIDVAAIGDQLEEKGWYVSRLARPPAIHQTLNLAHERFMEHYARDVADAVRAVKRLALTARTQEVSTY